METFKDRLRHRMETLDIKQEALAEMVGVKQPTIARMLSGEIKKPRSIVALAAALETTAEWLQHGTGPEEMAATPAPAPVDDRTLAAQAIDIAQEAGVEPKDYKAVMDMLQNLHDLSAAQGRWFTNHDLVNIIKATMLKKRG